MDEQFIGGGMLNARQAQQGLGQYRQPDLRSRLKVAVDEAEAHGIDVEIVMPDPGQKGFQVQPRCWVVERTFAWLNNYRRLSKDFEQWMQPSDATIYAAMSHLLSLT